MSRVQRGPQHDDDEEDKNGSPGGAELPPLEQVATQRLIREDETLVQIPAR